jgi:hypothetical protein
MQRLCPPTTALTNMSPCHNRIERTNAILSLRSEELALEPTRNSVFDPTDIVEELMQPGACPRIARCVEG